MPYKDLNDPRRRQALRRGSAKHYANNKAKVLKTTQNNKRKNKKKWLEFKSTLACKFCGENHPAALDFHHEDPSQKDREVSYYVKNYQYARAMEEVKKCMVLCANCHRILHFNEHQTLRKKRKKPRRSGA
jgi:hypothetical protein